MRMSVLVISVELCAVDERDEPYSQLCEAASFFRYHISSKPSQRLRQVVLGRPSEPREHRLFQSENNERKQYLK